MKKNNILPARQIALLGISVLLFFAGLQRQGALQAQNVGINAVGTPPNASAGLDVDYTNKGVLIPRVALTITTSNAPIGAGLATSLLVYNTATINDVTPGYYYWNGAAWVRFMTGSGASAAWTLTGNSGTLASTSAIGITANNNFIGTTDAIDWVMATNNLERIRISTAGNIGVWNINPRERLEVTGNARIGQAPSVLTTLSAAMVAGDLVANVVSTAGYPSSGTLIMGAWPAYEEISYTSITPTSFNGLTRGILGTVAAGYAIGATVNISLASAIKTLTLEPPMVVTGSGSTFFGGRPGAVYSASPGVVEINPLGTFSGLVIRNDPAYGLYFTQNMGTGTKIMMNGAGALTSGNGIYMGGGVSNAGTAFTGAFIRIEPSRTATATINDAGNFLRLTRAHAVNNVASTYTISGDLVRLYSNITVTAGTGVDNSSILSMNQAYINASGSILKVDGAGTGNLASLDAINAVANGVSVDVQSAGAGQYTFRATSNNGLTTGLYLRSDGNAGIGTAAPAYKLHLYGTSNDAADVYSQTDAGRIIKHWFVNALQSWSIGQLGTTVAPNHQFRITNETAGQALFVVNTSGNVGIGTVSPDASSKLDITSTNSGLLIPRVALSSTASNLPVGAGVVASLMVYNTVTIADVTPGFYYWGGAAWTRFTTGSGGSGWSLTGDGGTVDGTNFIGTTDDVPFNIKVNNQPAGRIEETGGGSHNRNTSFGYQALNVNIGTDNTATGFYALNVNTSGGINTANGAYALYYNTTGSYNTADGASALQSNTTGNYNSANSFSALLSNTIGSRNTAVGAGALNWNVAGSNATVIGYNAMYYANNQAGAFTNYNVAVGYEALRGSFAPASNIGNYNSALGYQALLVNTSGNNNIAVGHQSLYTNTTGSNNVSIGYLAGNLNSTGNSNIFIGRQAGQNNTVGGNIFVGDLAGQLNNLGANNVCIGMWSGNNMTTATASSNTFVGYMSGTANTIAGGNSFFGNNAGINVTTGNNNTCLGAQAGQNYTTAANNTFVGWRAGFYTVGPAIGGNNTFMGFQAGDNNQTGTGNICIGYNADVSGIALTNSTAIGNGASVAVSNMVVLGNNAVTATGFNGALMPYYGAVYNAGAAGQVLTSQGAGVAPQWAAAAAGVDATAWHITGNAGTIDGTNFIGTTDNIPFNIRVFNQKAGRISSAGQTFFGYLAGNVNTAVNNTGVGYRALSLNTSGDFNTAVGFNALQANTTGTQNTALGMYSLYVNTTNGFNTATGGYALYQNTGAQNTATGYAALYLNTIGQQNSGFGLGSVYNNTTGWGNTGCGFYTLYNNITGSNNTALGVSAFFAGTYSNSTALGANTVITVSNKVRIGDAAVTVIEGQVAYTFPSDGRFKNNVTEDVRGLDFINLLRPVIYNFDTRKFDEFLMHNISDSMRNVIMSGKDYTASSSVRQSGFIAQEVEQAAFESGYVFNGIHKPENENDNYSLAYSLFTVPLVEAVQELSKQNEALQLTQKSLIDNMRKQDEKIAALVLEIESLKKSQKK